MSKGKVYLIPTVLAAEALESIPAYVLDAVRDCQAFFVEQEKTARRYLKALWKEMVIDHYTWVRIPENGEEAIPAFIQLLREGKHIGILSEAGCPGVADPGQVLVAAAQESGFTVKPLTGPNSILLALMASGMNGQHFQFHGYLPIDAVARKRKLKELESHSRTHSCTEIFIETPYRNHALLKDILQTCHSHTRLCVAVQITGPEEYIRTLPVRQWQEQAPDLHKKPAIFLLLASTI
ncbi:MAG TPA: SAM-dependent methyltransferase [Sediminibacterium sp.]|nr:SAM-dependent methyltransferase [Sediminibacterium sp.]